MSPVIVGIIGLVVLILMILLGAPIGATMTGVGLLGLMYLISGNPAIVKLGLTQFDTIASWDLATLPLFLLMAHIVFSTGIVTNLFNMAAKWIGHQRGGMAMASVLGSGVFAAVSASSLATAVTMGLVALPEMKKYNYNSGMAAAAIAAGGTLGVMIPPSAGLIIFGIVTETSIGRLFLGGIIPGIIEITFYLAVIFIICTIKPDYGPPGPSYSFKEKILSFKSCGEMIALIIFVLGGLMAGFFTPTEAGAMGAFGAIVFSLLRRKLNWNNFKSSITETMKTTGMIYLILIGAFVFKYFMAVTTIPFVLADYVGALAIPPILVIVLILIVYLFLGCIMDAIAMILLTVPVFFPLVLGLGFDPVWFGVILVAMTEIGAITPPVGLNVYAIAGIVPDVPLTTIFRNVLPFVLADFLRIAVYISVPPVILFLPKIIMG